MAAPMTELLFLFLLGIASWSGCAAENTVTITGISCGPTGDSGVVASWDCDISQNLISAKIDVGKGCPGVVQSSTDVFKAGILANNIRLEIKDPIGELGKANFCKKIEVPDPDDDNCFEGEISVVDCDLSPFFKDFGVGEYEINTELSIDGEPIGNANLNIKVEG